MALPGSQTGLDVSTLSIETETYSLNRLLSGEVAHERSYTQSSKTVPLIAQTDVPSAESGLSRNHINVGCWRDGERARCNEPGEHRCADERGTQCGCNRRRQSGGGCVAAEG